MIFLIVVHSKPVGTTKKAHLNTMPVTNKLPEIDISRCLGGQIGEHDEMKKNSLTLLCLSKLSQTGILIPLNTFIIFIFPTMKEKT